MTMAQPRSSHTAVAERPTLDDREFAHAAEITVRTSTGRAWLDYWRRQHGHPELTHPMLVATPLRRLAEEGTNRGRRASDRSTANAGVGDYFRHDLAS
jgi:hypothetical protein